MTETSEGTLLWEPPAELKENAVITRYMGWLEEKKDLSFDGYNEHAFGNARSDAPALVHRSELRPLAETSWAELREKTAALSAALHEMGVERGDRVVAYLPNVPEAVVAFLATASIGAVWSSGSPDFGAGSIVDRFKQIEPKVLFAVDGYRYGGKDYDRTEVVAKLQGEIPTLEKTVVLPYLNDEPDLGS